MERYPSYVVQQFPDGSWEVVDVEGLCINPESFNTKAEAEKYREEAYRAHEEWEACQRYWSSTRFGE